MLNIKFPPPRELCTTAVAHLAELVKVGTEHDLLMCKVTTQQMSSSDPVKSRGSFFPGIPHLLPSESSKFQMPALITGEGDVRTLLPRCSCRETAEYCFPTAYSVLVLCFK